MKFTFSLAATALAAALPTTGHAAENILFNCFFPPRHYVCTDFLPEMARRVDAATDGRVKIRIPPKSLAAPPEQYQGVVNGVMDGAVQFNGFLSADLPGTGFGLLPFVGHQDAAATSLALWDTYQRHFAEVEAEGDVVLLGMFAYNGGDIYSVTDTPITTVDDLARRKIWAVGGGPADMAAAAGSSVISGPAVQMLEIVSKGVVDGHMGIPQTEVTQFKLTDYTRSATVFDDKIFQASFSFFVSRQKWEAITPEDRQAIDAALGRDFVAYMGAFQDQVFARAHQELVDAGVEFVAGPPEMEDALKSFGAPVTAAWTERVAGLGVDGAAVLADFEAAHEAARGPGMN